MTGLYVISLCFSAAFFIQNAYFIYAKRTAKPKIVEWCIFEEGDRYDSNARFVCIVHWKNKDERYLLLDSEWVFAKTMRQPVSEMQEFLRRALDSEKENRKVDKRWKRVDALYTKDEREGDPLRKLAEAELD